MSYIGGSRETHSQIASEHKNLHRSHCHFFFFFSVWLYCNFAQISEKYWLCLSLTPGTVTIPFVAWDRKSLKWTKWSIPGFENPTLPKVSVGCRKQGNQDEKKKWRNNWQKCSQDTPHAFSPVDIFSRACWISIFLLPACKHENKDAGDLGQRNPFHPPGSLGSRRKSLSISGHKAQPALLECPAIGERLSKHAEPRPLNPSRRRVKPKFQQSCHP